MLFIRIVCLRELRCWVKRMENTKYHALCHVFILCSSRQFFSSSFTCVFFFGIHLWAPLCVLTKTCIAMHVLLKFSKSKTINHKKEVVHIKGLKWNFEYSNNLLKIRRSKTKWKCLVPFLSIFSVQLINTYFFFSIESNFVLFGWWMKCANVSIEFEFDTINGWKYSSKAVVCNHN